ncbi:FeoA domain protein [Candidatus Methanoplasma termitum]|uniref:FeoA domain protein n=1 Tax=Candidatus Methanoplasma termitum TaxID=1577791 RepID=A0A0A7LCK9_9ARCH|nr:FeoA family protein [Candidatus Methanoplasma termitum]AIZ56027.1 FeoA domain protein [Candidatus Methanoplasma termitum]
MDRGCDCKNAENNICKGVCTGSMCIPLEDASASGVPLVTAKIGDGGKIVMVTAKQDTRKFLCELGFVIGARVSVINENAGNMILDIKGSRIAMDRAIASKIFYVPA